MAPLFYKCVVDQVFIDHHMQHGKRQGGVRARTHRHPDIGQSDIRLHRWLDGDYFYPTLFGG